MSIFHNASKFMKFNAIPFNILWGIQIAQKDATEVLSSQYKTLGFF